MTKGQGWVSDEARRVSLKASLIGLKHGVKAVLAS